MRLNRIAWLVVVLAGLTAVSSILAAIFGAHAILLAIGSAIFTIVAARVAFSLQGRQNEKRRFDALRRQQLKQQEDAKRSLERAKLDRDCAELLQRAETAVNSILTSDARTHNLLHPPVNEKELRHNVHAIWIAAREITDLRAELRSISAQSLSKGRTAPDSPKSGYSLDLGDLFGGGGDFGRGGRLGDLLGGVYGGRTGSQPARRQPAKTDKDIPAGPMTADAIKPVQRAIAIVLQSAESRLLNLERYASSVRKVDVTYWDWIGTQEVERRLNPRIRELLAKTAEDKLAADEFNRLAQKATEAEQAFRQSIDEANLAGEILALPDDEGPGVDKAGS